MSAPTGAGKTVVADHAVDRALRLGRRAVYTTPVKALSNQKHRDLVERLGAPRVGLLTGDRKINPGAPVVVMTTEVLRALLYARSAGEAAILDRLEAVVLDEAHFITDPERGPAWEEVVIHAPLATRLVALSATLDEAGQLARWIEALRGPTDLVTCRERPVPLRHVYAIGRLDNSPPLLLPVEVEGSPNPTAIALDGIRVRQTRGEGLRRRFRSRSRAVPPQRQDLLELLIRQELTPAIWFVLSRMGCESIARALVDTGAGYTNVEEALELRRRADSLAASLPAADLRTLDFGGWSARLAGGVATHHGGLLPAQRELVERAFQEGLIKVVLATETLALGVNLPARTVVVDRVRRAEAHNGLMSAATFAQLAGRAGRRGLDRKGTAIVPWSDDVSFLEVASLVCGPSRPLRSWFRPSPVMVANLHRAGSNATRRALDGSLAAFLRARRRGHLEQELARVIGDITTIRDHACAQCAPASPVVPRGAPADLRAATLGGLERGDVVVDPGRPSFSPAVVVAAPRTRRGLVAVDIVQIDGRRVVLTERDLRRPPVTLARVELGEWVAGERGHARAAADALSGLDLTTATARARSEARRAAPAPTGESCSRSRLPRLERLRRGTGDAIAELAHGDHPAYAAILDMLDRLGHLDGKSLTARGERLRRLFVPSGLPLAEFLAEADLGVLDPAELAASLSFFTPVSSSRQLAAAESHPTVAVKALWELAGRTYERVARAAGSAGADVPPGPDRSMCAVIHRWCTSASLADALDGGGISPGDLGREVRQIAELLDQVVRAEPELVTLAETTQALLLRGAFADPA